MQKIKRIKFSDHPILKNLELDFCGADGRAVDTVIIAGENGSGKSTVLNYLYDIALGRVSVESDLLLEGNGREIHLIYKYDEKHSRIFANEPGGPRQLPFTDIFNKQYGLNGIFSDVEINFHAEDISSVTSMALDASGGSRRSSTDLPNQTKQLLIDVQALDDAELSRAMRANPRKTKAELQIEERMPRFTKAFAKMFNGLTYDRIENVNGHKEIYFKKNDVDIPIDGLSSGEKQVVYRGCFLLRDINATKGAFVFIDEPEISLHPNWQIKIMDYYKGIFTSEDGVQTSQIFAVTHSPYIIHNENRRNDKVIVLARDANGDIVVKDKPEYYMCNSIEVIEDAFAIQGFDANKSTVYLEGRTDEKYFNRALQVYGCNVPFRFQWVGHLDERGQEVNSGDKNIDAAYQFLVGRNLSIQNFCLKDCDTNREPKTENNVTILSIPQVANSKGINRGIENALVLDNIDLAQYYTTKTSKGEYGEEKKIQTFDKMACCEGICAMDESILEGVFINLKAIIDRITTLYNRT